MYVDSEIDLQAQMNSQFGDREVLLKRMMV